MNLIFYLNAFCSKFRPHSHNSLAHEKPMTIFQSIIVVHQSLFLLHPICYFIQMTCLWRYADLFLWLMLSRSFSLSVTLFSSHFLLLLTILLAFHFFQSLFSSRIDYFPLLLPSSLSLPLSLSLSFSLSFSLFLPSSSRLATQIYIWNSQSACKEWGFIRKIISSTRHATGWTR